MKKLINLTVDIDTSYDSDTVGHIISNAVNSCNTDNGFVNLVKVHVENVNSKQLGIILSNLQDAFESQGIDNCILIPIDDRIRDITVEEIKCTYGLND